MMCRNRSWFIKAGIRLLRARTTVGKFGGEKSGGDTSGKNQATKRQGGIFNGIALSSSTQMSWHVHLLVNRGKVVSNGSCYFQW